MLRMVRLLKRWRRFDAAVIVACFVLAASATVALASENLFLNHEEPPGQGSNNGQEHLNNHIWGWAQNGTACVHYYIVTNKSWSSAVCSYEINEGSNEYPPYAPLSKPGAWNNPNRYYGEHLTQGKQWW